MKKSILKGMAFLLMGSSIAGCSDDFGADNGGEGRVFIHAKINTDVKVLSRAAEENADLASSATIWISSEKGLVRKYNGIGQVPSEGIRLVSGNYVAEAWAGDSVAASFDTRWFKGREEFQIADNSVTSVNLVCRIANAVVALTYDDGVADVLTDCTFEIGHKGGSLTFDSTTPADAKGYFMMSSYDKDLNYTLTGTRVDGKGTYTYKGTIKDAKPTTEYRISVKHDGSVVTPVGGAFIQVEVNEQPLEEITDSFELTGGPQIRGIGYNISKPILGQTGTFESQAVWIAAVAQMTEINVNSAELMQILGLEGTGFELFHMDEAYQTALSEAGINWTVFNHEDTGYQEVKLVFGDRVLNKFTNGDHAITIEAGVNDDQGRARTTTATLTVRVSDATVEAVELAEYALSTYATKATLVGRVLKDGPMKVGFKYAPFGSQNWTTVWVDQKGSAYTAGEEFSAVIENLTPGTKYSYKALADESESADNFSFTTETAAQLPNAGFEEWCENSKGAMIPSASADNFYWDSGNHGSITMKKNITTSDSSIKHSGEYSIKLESQFVGIGSIGKFAAGNVFIGKYLKTDGMDGVLGWGRAFTSRPKALHAWVKYTPGTVSHADSSNPDGVVKGDQDKGIIYIALVDDTKTTYDSEQWPVVVKTKSSDRSLFDKNGQQVIAYGEYVFTGATSGDGLMEITINIDYKRTDVRPSNIVLVASASKMGDYFTGGPSVLNIDDFELIY